MQDKHMVTKYIYRNNIYRAENNTIKKKVYKKVVSYYIHNTHQRNTDDGGQAMGEELRHVQMSS